tara:strand:+ start:532 stop:726 length:195 start_codon:yes stop_codon:yes gene_type:complete
MFDLFPVLMPWFLIGFPLLIGFLLGNRTTPVRPRGHTPSKRDSVVDSAKKAEQAVAVARDILSD